MAVQILLLSLILASAPYLALGQSSTTTPTPTTTLAPCSPYPDHANYTKNVDDIASGTVLTLTCAIQDHFYDFNQKTLQVTCGPTGEWTPNNTEHCTMYFPPCDPFPETNFTLRDSESLESGTTVTYTCEEPNMLFEVDLPTVVTQCNASRMWTQTPVSCRYILCDPVPMVNYAFKNSVLRLSGTSVLYTCKQGYTWDGVTITDVHWTMKCEDDPPVWKTVNGINLLQPSECLPTSCPNITEPAYTLPKDTLETIAGTTVNLWCWDGFFTNGQRLQSSICRPTGAFQPVQDCHQISCPAMTVKNATTNNPALLYGTVATWTCDSDLLFPGGENKWRTFCNHQGLWDPLPPESGCILGKCSQGFVSFNTSCFYISDPDRGQRTRHHAAQERCTLMQANLASVLNEDERIFLSDNSYGLTNEDYWLGGYRDETTDEWMWYGGVNDSYNAWLPGYPDPDYLHVGKDMCVRLTSGGYWKDRYCTRIMPYICRKGQVCTSVPAIKDGSLWHDTKPYYEVGEKIHYKCKSGYHFPSDKTANKTLYCRPGGFWDWIESCQVINCPSLRRIPHAIPSTTATVHGTVVTYTCKDGYNFWDNTASKQIECLNSGSWSSVVRYCKEILCPFPGIENANYTYGRNRIGEADIYVCNEGFYYAGYTPVMYNISFVCGADGVWEPPITQCARLPCPLYSHDKAELSDDFQLVGFELNVTCVNGYKFPDNSLSKIMTCQPNQEYSPPSLPPCIPMQCPPLPVIPNATPWPQNRSVLTVLNYTCNPGFQYADGETFWLVDCDIKTRTWQNVPHECVSKNANFQAILWAPFLSPSMAFGGGLIGSLVLVFVILLPVIVDASTVNQDLQNLIDDINRKDDEERKARLDALADSESGSIAASEEIYNVEEDDEFEDLPPGYDDMPMRNRTRQSRILNIEDDY